MSFWKNKSVLVTGATGLVGSWLVHELLKQGSNVTALVLDNDPASQLFRSGDIDRISVVSGNLSSYHDVARSMYTNECTEVFHLGAQTIVGTALLDPISTFESNVQGTWNVLEAVRQSKGLVKAVVVASSDKAYGSSGNLPYLEDHPLHGDGPYDVSKSCTDLIAQSYGNTYGLPVTVARCGNIYGGGDLNWNRIVPGTFRSLLRNEQPVLRSDGTFVRDYLHVDDIVSAYLLLGESTDKVEFHGQGFNFSDESPLTVMQIYNAICESAGKAGTEPLILNAASSEIKDQYLDSTKAHNVLGWRASVTLEEGLKKSFDWYRSFFVGAK